MYGRGGGTGIRARGWRAGAGEELVREGPEEGI